MISSMNPLWAQTIGLANLAVYSAVCSSTSFLERTKTKGVRIEFTLDDLFHERVFDLPVHGRGFQQLLWHP
jgi:hypothetical protein